jgi:hypothetical protein
MMETEIWDQQEGETAAGFALFAVFREMHPTLRKYRAVMEHDPSQRSYDAIKQYAHDQAWIPRAKAYDAHADSLRQAQAAAERRIANEKFVKAGMEMADKCLDYIATMDPTKIGPQYLPRIIDASIKAIREGTGVREEKGSDATFEQTIEKLSKEVTSQ